jgi:TPR repeat protein
LNIYVKSLWPLIMIYHSLPCWECCAYAASERLSLHVPTVIRVESGIEAPLPILITNAEAVQKAMILIRGIPTGARLTAGRQFASGVWAFKASAARAVRLITPSDTNQDVQLILSLVTLEGVSLGNVTTRLLIAPPRPAGQTPATAAPPQAVAAIPKDQTALPPQNSASLTALPERGPVRVLLRDDIERILKFMERGDQHLLDGKIASARRFYQRAAESGWPEGANAIARTYDAAHLSRFPILGGIEPNEALAQEWYSKARELNATLHIQGIQTTGHQ